MFSIVMTSLTDKPLILQWEVWLRSLLGLEGLTLISNTWIGTFVAFNFRLAFMNKLEPCVKGILSHCLKDTYKSTKALNKNIDASLARSREYQQHNYCYGKGLSLPALEKNQCKTKYLRVKEKCEEDYVEAYRENKADDSLCQ